MVFFPGQEQVDALRRQQDGALERQRMGARPQVLAQVGAVGDADELVSGDVQYFLHGARL